MATEVAGNEYEAPNLTNLGTLADMTKGSGGPVGGDVSLGINGLSIIDLHI